MCELHFVKSALREWSPDGYRVGVNGTDQVLHVERVIHHSRIMACFGLIRVWMRHVL
jgi:hypothetical protein